MVQPNPLNVGLEGGQRGNPDSGAARCQLAPRGRVKVLGEDWAARLANPASVSQSVEAKTTVLVVGVDGLTLIVEPPQALPQAQRPEQTAHAPQVPLLSQVPGEGRAVTADGVRADRPGMPPRNSSSRPGDTARPLNGHARLTELRSVSRRG